MVFLRHRGHFLDGLALGDLFELPGQVGALAPCGVPARQRLTGGRLQRRLRWRARVRTLGHHGVPVMSWHRLLLFRFLQPSFEGPP